MDINAWLRPPGSHKVISSISGLQGGVGRGRDLEVVVLQKLRLMGTGLILAGFEGDHFVERSHLPSYQISKG